MNKAIDEVHPDQAGTSGLKALQSAVTSEWSNRGECSRPLLHSIDLLLLQLEGY